MDERTEWQLKWLEEAVFRVVREAEVIEEMVTGGPQILARLRDISLDLQVTITELREALGPEVEPSEAEAVREEKHEAEKTRPQTD